MRELRHRRRAGASLAPSQPPVADQGKATAGFAARHSHPAVTLPITAGLTALGSLAIHMFVPAMPMAAADLGASADGIQLTLTLYLTAMAVSQVAAGPISDAVGRRPLIIAAVMLFVIGSLVAWAATNLLSLLAGRIVQAAGGASGLVVSRAMAGDTAGAPGRRDMALLMAVAMLSPMLAPVLGAWLSVTRGWHAVFALLTCLGLVIGGCAILWLPETRTGPRARLSFGAVIGDWHRLSAERRFRRNLMLGCSLSAGLYIFLTVSPFLLLSLGTAQRDLGFCFAGIAGALAAGTLSAGVLAGRVEPTRLVRLAAWSLVAITAIFVAVALVQRAGAVTLLVAMAFYAFAGGLIVPNALSGALAASGGRPGLAASAYGAIQMTSNTLAAAAALALPAGSVTGFSLALAGTALIAAALAGGKG
jgi:MFS transporter, DHA1 family, multidrug resistance protein